MDFPDETFPQICRIRSSGEYQRLRQRGKKKHTRNFIIYTSLRETGPARLGLTVSRKVGRAVTRNRVKRLIREFFRHNRSSLVTGLDVSVVAKPGCGQLDYHQICDELMFLIRLHSAENIP